jgi:anti-sigma-K factor RskA
MSVHDVILDMLPAYALGALERVEEGQAESHLASCDRCTRALGEYRPVVNALANSVPMMQPSDDLKVRTMRRAMSEKRLWAAVEPSPRSRLPDLRPWFAPALAGAALVAAIITFGFAAWQTSQLGRQVQAQKDLMTVVAYAQGTVQIVQGTNKAPDAVGRLYFDPDSPVAALVAVNMPPLGSNRIYEVWLTTADGSKASGGLFRTDSEGNGWILVRARQHLGSYVQVGVTDEPAGGSDAPTTSPVLLAKFTSP